MTGEKPIDAHKYPEICKNIKSNQEKLLSYHNKNRVKNIYVKSNRRRKDATVYTKHIVKEDQGDKILTTKNKVYHEDSIISAVKPFRLLLTSFNLHLYFVMLLFYKFL